ncbi:MAG: FtsX-like permease family protein [Candidatus Aminicenantes bacterium]|nr:FtsX-like permease family protein [Candidatus Aminicenantes bacterium]
MIRFLLKGVLRDRGRSLFPFLVAAAGTFLTVAFYGYFLGMMNNMIRSNANLRHGHLKVMTRAYARDAAQVPNDLALTGVGALMAELDREFPNMDWVARISFGGLLDVPDEEGETRIQAPVAGLAVDIRTAGSPEPGLFGLQKILVRGRLPRAPGELLMGDELALKLGLAVGDEATLIGSSMAGGLAMANFTVAGTIRFGIRAMDKTGLIADLADVRRALDMDDAAGEVLGLFKDGIYRQERIEAAALAFNDRYAGRKDEDLPVMQTLAEQPGMDILFVWIRAATPAIIFIFLLAMSLVMWNAGLVGTLRRYGEFGLRLAIGEAKGRVYRAMLAEALMVGFIGSAAGTVLGLGLSWYLQVHGIDVSSMLKNFAFPMETVLRSRITPFSFVIGFIPGLLASLIGTAIAGRAIYKRQTARLFKELES